MADPAVVRGVLRRAGYTDVTVRGLDGEMYLGADPGEAHAVTLGLLGWMLEGLDAARQGVAREALRATIDAHAGIGGVALGSAVWLVTARSDLAPTAPDRGSGGAWAR